MSPRAVHALDWRRGYVVCEHVAAMPAGDDPKGPPTAGLWREGLDVCCDACQRAGFLGAPLDMTTEPSGLVIGRRK